MAIPNGVRLQWDLTKEDISKRTDSVIEKSRQVYEKVGSLSPDQVTFENVLLVSIHEFIP